MAILLALLMAAQPVILSGQVADPAARAALLERARVLYPDAQLVDELVVGPVQQLPGWNASVMKVLAPALAQVRRGQFQVDGNVASLSGEVANEGVRQQVQQLLAASLPPPFKVNVQLRLAQAEQAVLDAALADRIIEFESGKVSLTEAGRAILDQMSVALLKVKGKRVQVIGHTDSAGARAANLALSLARAEAVRSYVAGKGVDPASIATSGEGPDRPVADNGGEAGRARNRRIEFRVLP